MMKSQKVNEKEGEKGHHNRKSSFPPSRLFLIYFVSLSMIYIFKTHFKI